MVSAEKLWCSDMLGQMKVGRSGTWSWFFLGITVSQETTLFRTLDSHLLEWRPFALWRWLPCIRDPHNVVLSCLGRRWPWVKAAGPVPLPLRSLQGVLVGIHPRLRRSVEKAWNELVEGIPVVKPLGSTPVVSRWTDLLRDSINWERWEMTWFSPQIILGEWGTAQWTDTQSRCTVL